LRVKQPYLLNGETFTNEKPLPPLEK
jgi:hypothetical protein